MFKHYSLKQKIIMIFTLAIYFAFAFFVIKTAINDKSTAGILFVIIGVVALIFGSLNEYLKLLYNETLWYLNFKLDLDKASEIYDKLETKDVFKTYVNNRGLFDTMVALERKDPRLVLQTIEENDKKFSANVEMLLIKCYYQMRAYLMLGQTQKLNTVYNDVKNIENMKKRPKIFQYDELDAIHKLGIKQDGEAYKLLKNVNMAYMNPKECKFILEELILTAPNNEKEAYKEQLEILMETVNESK